jgi:hypothetical protein
MLALIPKFLEKTRFLEPSTVNRQLTPSI